MTMKTGCNEERKEGYGGDQMKNNWMAISLLVIVLMMSTGWAEAEEAGCYQSADKWIIRVYSDGVVSPYSLSLAVIDTNGVFIPASQIEGLKTLTNPYLFEGAATKPDLSLGCDAAGTAYILHDSSGQLSFTTISDIVSVSVGTPVLQSSTTLISFGTITSGTTKDSAVTVTNIGTAALHITSVTVPAAPFSKISDTCTGVAIAPSGICSIGIRFAPTAATPYNSSFSITSDGGNATITLQGTGSKAGGGPGPH